MNKTTLLKATSVIAIATLFSSCGGSSSTEAEGTSAGKTEASSPMNKERDAKAKKVFSGIPSPVETTALLKDAGSKYNATYLNPIENAAKYSSVKSKALNLGIYGSDLSFISLFDQTQESMLYLKCTNTLASGLGISGAFDENTTNRIQNNMDKKDSLLSIIEQSYWTSDAYLVKNGQPGVSSLIVTGGWVEGLFIATRIGIATKNEKIITQIGQQKASLDNLIDLLDISKNENAGIGEAMKMLTDLKKVFDSSVTSADGKLTDDQFKALADKTAELRNNIIKP